MMHTNNLNRLIPSNQKWNKNIVVNDHIIGFRWNVLTHDKHVEISSSYVYAEEFLIEIKFERIVLQAYLVPDQPVTNYDPREDRWV